MSLLKAEPFSAIRSMDELLAVAYAMEQEAVAGYTQLAARMRQEGRPELAAAFERIIAAETQHLEYVATWSRQVSGKLPDRPDRHWETSSTFDDEGAATIAPELLSAYRAFSMAVRNEERAFLFWTYVAAQAPSQDLRLAAERMAQEELGHISTLRRERRQAFHALRHRPSAQEQGWTLAALERRLADHLEQRAETLAQEPARQMRERAGQARSRAVLAESATFAHPPLLASVSGDVADRVEALCELVLECYLNFADSLPGEADRNLAQTLAADTVHCLSALRHPEPPA